MVLLLRVDGAPFDVQAVNSFAEGVHSDAVVELGGPDDGNTCVSAVQIAVVWHGNLHHIISDLIYSFTNILSSCVEGNIPKVYLASWRRYPVLLASRLNSFSAGNVPLDR